VSYIEFPGLDGYIIVIFYNFGIQSLTYDKALLTTRLCKPDSEPGGEAVPG
jgi:hypothetical protein